MRVAAIDVGSNSVKVAIAEGDGQRSLKVLKDASVVTRLAEGMDRNGQLSQEAQDRALAAIRDHIALAAALGADSVRIVATSAVRDARNGPGFASAVRSSFGIEMEIISGDDEGRLSYSAVARDAGLGLGDSEIAVVDVGGGSTEVTLGSGSEVRSALSVPLGSVRLTERFLRSDPPSVGEIAQAAALAEERLGPPLRTADVGSVVLVGGAAVNLARIVAGVPLEDTQRVHGARIAVADMEKALDQLSRLKCSARQAVVGLEPKRAVTIVAGIVILGRAVAALRHDECFVSIRGLRYGVLYRMLGGES